MRPVSLQAAFFFSPKQVLELMNIALSIFVIDLLYSIH